MKKQKMLLGIGRQNLERNAFHEVRWGRAAYDMLSNERNAPRWVSEGR